MEVEDAFEKWLADWVSRNPSGELSPKTVWFVASRWGYGQNADRIAALEAERDALRMTEEAAMRAALRVMSNLEDRRGVLDGVDEDVKQEITDEIAFAIFAANRPLRP